MMNTREFLRSVKWYLFPLQARIRMYLPVGRVRGGTTFLIGCGRSGTTIVGELLGSHSEVCYINEPIHYWYAIDSRTDVADFLGGSGDLWLDPADADEVKGERLSRLFGQLQLLTGASRIIEKLPVNSFRMEWLDRLSPGARFINIIRDGRDVIASIKSLDDHPEYRVAGKPMLHQWWGVDFHKWKRLAQMGMAKGFYSAALDEIGGVAARDQYCMAAYEWLVSLRQIRTSVRQLGLGPDRYHEVRYEALLEDPESVLRGIERMLGIKHDPAMIAESRSRLHKPTLKDDAIVLPQRMYLEFEAVQRELGYTMEGVGVR